MAGPASHCTANHRGETLFHTDDNAVVASVTDCYRIHIQSERLCSPGGWKCANKKLHPLFYLLTLLLDYVFILPLPEKTSSRKRGSLTRLRPQTNRKTRSSSTWSLLTPGEKPNPQTDSDTISKHSIMNIPSTSADNESNTSPKVMSKIRQQWLMCSHNSLIRVVTLSRENSLLKTVEGCRLISV